MKWNVINAAKRDISKRIAETDQGAVALRGDVVEAGLEVGIPGPIRNLTQGGKTKRSTGPPEVNHIGIYYNSWS